MSTTFEPKLARRFLRLWGLRSAWHRAELIGAERLPAQGAAVLVSNHGRLDFDVFILLRLILRQRGRFVRALADRMWFGLPFFRGVVPRIGAVEGTRANARARLDAGDLVLTYPGGVREIMASRFGVEHTLWRDRTGFARVALEAGVPIIPIASVGVNNGHLWLSSGRWLGRLLFRGLLRLGPRYDDYRDPITLSTLLVPLPFSTAVHFPFPCKVRYVVGDPVRAEADESPESLAARVEGALRTLLRAHGRLHPE